ncbi:uncharacterized protein TNCV_407011 [Trichonephila clavipes]|nr:uncharacterized protein TNCV_407011 [Trichonephila clavipes]
MKQKQQTKNKHSGSARARSDQWIMDMQNRLKSTVEGKISRIETFIESANEETDSVEIKVKLRSLIQQQKNAEELRNNYYAIPNVKDAELTAVDEDLHLLEVRLESFEVRIETILNSSKKSSSGAVMKTNVNFEIKTKIPPLVLPEFSGKYEEFSSFKIQFDDLITNNILLSESQKLYYLRSCLTHEVNYLCMICISAYRTLVSLQAERGVGGRNWDEKMDGDCKTKLAAGTVGFKAGVSLFTDPISDPVLTHSATPGATGAKWIDEDGIHAVGELGACKHLGFFRVCVGDPSSAIKGVDRCFLVPQLLRHIPEGIVIGSRERRSSSQVLFWKALIFLRSLF